MRTQNKSLGREESALPAGPRTNENEDADGKTQRARPMAPGQRIELPQGEQLTQYKQRKNQKSVQNLVCQAG